ncbi:sodium:proton exchanger [Candidatus Gracilibacteria bacterium]|nr:sodium:proton exchanger [Candidatus Gracilibacteria bacterium]
MKRLLFESLQKLDFIVWGLTLLFFIGSAVFLGGDLHQSFLGASGIIVLMFFIGFSIELILASLKNVKGVGKITGFITNGPEALVLIVGLIGGNVLFAASTPLGSNVMNPILLLIGILISGYLIKLKKFNHKGFFLLGFLLTAILAIVFFKIPENYYIYWLILSFIISIYLFTRKTVHTEDHDEEIEPVNKSFLPLGLVILIISGYFLDPVVSFTAEASLAPKGVIGFLVLATLTSWPEFKSVLALLKRNKTIDAFENILVSNITNLWLAIIGIIIWLLLK